MKDVKDVICEVYDLGGMFMEYARRLARDFKKVYYHVPNCTEASTPHKSFIGYGYPEIELVYDFYGKHFDESDLIFFPDVGMGAMQCEIEQEYAEDTDRRVKKVVWGSRMAEELELEREATIELFKEIAVPVGPSKNIMGVTKLREYLKDNPDVFVKISRWRGLRETFKSFSGLLSENTLDLLASELGMLKDLIPFVVAKRLDNKVELGIDKYSVDGQIPAVCLGGIEKKDAGYGGRIKRYADFPKPLRDVSSKMSPILKQYGMRGPISDEVRIGKDGIPYVVDMTMRFPSPPGELYQEMYTNYPEIAWMGANGVLKDPTYDFQFGIQVNIGSENGKAGEWQALTFPDKFDRNIKLHNAMKMKDAYFIIPTGWHLGEIGAVVGWGKSLDDAAKMVKTVAKEIEGESLCIEVDGVVEKIEEELDKARKMGLEML